jgi:hypothetical protein
VVRAAMLAELQWSMMQHAVGWGLRRGQKSGSCPSPSLLLQVGSGCVGQLFDGMQQLTLDCWDTAIQLCVATVAIRKRFTAAYTLL